jgi:hypothetical protein
VRVAADGIILTTQKNSWPALSHTSQEKEDFAMREIDDHARQRKTLTHGKPDNTRLLWTDEHHINNRECLRAELRKGKTHAALDLRRWSKPPAGLARPTDRGFAIAVRHLLAVRALLDAAIAQAKDSGLLDEGGAL